MTITTALPVTVPVYIVNTHTFVRLPQLPEGRYWLNPAEDEWTLAITDAEGNILAQENMRPKGQILTNQDVEIASCYLMANLI